MSKRKKHTDHYRKQHMGKWLKYILVLGVGLMLLAIGGCANLENTPSASSQEETGAESLDVTAAVLRDFPPHYNVDENDQPVGFAIDVMDAVAGLANLNVTYLVMDSWSEANGALRSGQVDIIPNNGVTSERQAEFGFTRPVETFAVSIFVRETTSDIENIEDLSEHKVAVVETNVGVTLLQGRDDIKSIEYRDVNIALLQLLAGEVDALIYPEPTVWLIARSASIEDRIKVVGIPLIEIKRGMAVQKGEEDLLLRLDEAVGNFVGTEEYERIYIKWYGEPKPFWTIQRTFWGMGGLLFIVLIVMLVWRYRSITDLNKQLLVNIAEREKSELELRESESLLRTIAANYPNSYLSIIEKDMTIGFSSGQEFTKQNIDPNQFVGMTLEQVFAEHTDFIREQYLSTFNGAECTFEMFNNNQNQIYRTIPIFSADGSISRIISFVENITDRKRAEEALVATEKLSGIGVLAAGIAHEINSPLQVITGISESLGRRIQKNALEEGDANQMNILNRNAWRIAKIIKALLLYAHPSSGQMEKYDLNQVIKETLLLIEHQLKSWSNISIHTDLDPSLPDILCDRNTVSQVLINLINNSRDAMPQGGHIYLSTTFIPEQHCVLMKIKDTGVGIPLESQTRIYDPFFTNNEIGKGTGLGLSIVKGIMETHGGTISVDSAPDKGACFTLSFPKNFTQPIQSEEDQT